MDTSKINSKTTKAELMEIIKEQEAKLREKDSLCSDPAKEAKMKEKERVLASAEDAVTSEIFSEKLVSRYNDVVAAIDIKEKELKEIYGIEKNAQTLVALINGYKGKEEELKEAHEKVVAERKEEIRLLSEEKIAMLDSIDEETEAKKKEIEKQRQREENEYAYDLMRQRKLENDEWQDQKKTREAELRAKEVDLAERFKTLEERESYVEELETKVNAIPGMLETAKEEGIQKGKADADKSHVFEIRSLKTSHEYEVKSLNDKIAVYEANINRLENANAELQEKLDTAYAQMRDLAADTVKSTGGVKILSSDKDSK